ncbi:MAG: glutamate-1-semialdehyde 2,1-aminomutase [Candidatus Methylomirabilales bacterium]
MARLERSRMLQARAHAVIPGGCHTYAKGDDQYPELAPGFLARGSGCRVWDVDGNEYIEYGMGLRAVTLGHAYPPVVEAAYRQMLLGNNFVRPASLEVECAEALRDMIPGAEMVKFAKNGSDATSAAVKLSRAYTGRAVVAVCAEHPFFSVDDWFIGTTPMAAGIPKAVRDLTVKFHYNDLGSVEALFRQYPGQIACLILEAEKDVPPAGDFLHRVHALCRGHGALFVLDEMITGFRWHNGGAQAYYGLEPDLSAFGKGLGNGFSVSALVGKRDIMRLGGPDHDRERVFLLSLTHGAENPCLAAALEVMRIYRREPVVETLWRQGARLAAGMGKAIAEHGLEAQVRLLGRPCALAFATRDGEGQPSQPLRTLFLQELARRGILAPSLVVSYSHTDADIDRTIEAIHDALRVYRLALEEGVEKYLVGRPSRPVFRRFN